MLADILGINPNKPTQIGKLRVDIVRSYEVQYEQDVSAHPVEDGAEVHDNIVNKPTRVNMTIGISSLPVTWMWANGTGKHKFSDGLAALVAIRNEKQPVTIVRPDRILSDMVMTSCRLSKTDESRSIQWVECSFQHIVKAVVQTAKIPPEIVEASLQDGVGETKSNGGAANQKNLDSASSNASAIAEESWLEQTVNAVKGWFG